MKQEILTPYTLTVPEGVFPLGGDALALGEFASVKPGWRVCDLGTGSGALLLLLSRREKTLKLVGVERDECSAGAAERNLKENGLEGQILWEDLRKTSLQPGSFDLVVSNPPYFPVGSGANGGSFRSEEFCRLEELVLTAARLLRNGGRFALCHRPERLSELMCALSGAGLEPKRMQLISHAPEYTPSLVLLEAVRQGRRGLEVLPTKYLSKG